MTKTAALSDRFWRKVARSGPADCWEWQAALCTGGYGSAWNGRSVLAHRMAYELHNGPIPGGLVVRHRCDNPRCVNPAHLELGTQADNVRDRVRRGRSRYLHGEQNHQAILTASQVEEIRQSPMTGKALAAAYGVSPMTISNIRTGKSWRPAA